ncbi:MAG: efflux RND transporter permease subunit [Patescibacteria group bacterium UBA2103]
MFHFWNFFLSKRPFSYLLIGAFIFFGLVSIIAIPKESAPEVKVPIGVVSSGLPNASAEDIETLITNKLEQEFKSSLEGVKNITSTTREGSVGVVVEFEASADLEDSIRKLRDAADNARSELPDDAFDPVVSEINFADQPIMTISVLGPVAIEELTSIANFVEEELEKVSGVSKVDTGGVRDKEVQVIVSQESLKTYGINLSDVVGALSRTNASLPAGDITIGNAKYAIKFEGDIDTPEEVADLAILSVGGQPVYVRDIADVRVGLEETRTISRVSLEGANPQNAISFSVYKRSGGDITRIARSVHEKLDELRSTDQLQGLQTLVTYDMGEEVEKDLVNLTRTGLQTVFLVTIILFIALGWREALIAGLAIPLSFIIGFIGLYNSGNTLNFVSLFSLILAVGILVDSAIVIVEGIHTRMKNWEGKLQSAREAIKEYNYPITAGTFTTIAVFAPLFLVSGVTGEFIASIPFTIIFVLLASLFVALGLIPLIASSFMKRRSTSKMEEIQEKYTHKLQDWYKEKVQIILGKKRRETFFIWGIIGLFILSFFLPALGLVKVTFFEQGDVENLFVDIELPQGTTLARSNLEAQKIEEILLQDSRIADFTTTIGQASPFNGEGTTDSKFANMQITLVEDRKETSTEILKDLRKKVAHITTSDIRIDEPSDGPPTGDAISVELLGNNQDELLIAGAQVKALFEDIEGTANIQTSARDNAAQFVLSIDRAKAVELGLSPLDVAQVLRTSISGVDATSIPQSDTDVDIVVKTNLATEYSDPHETNRATLDEVRQLTINGPQGPVLLGSLITESYEVSNAVIRHKDGKRVLTVSGDKTPEANTFAIVAEFMQRQGELDLPSSVTLSIGGESDESNQAFAEMLLSLIVGLLAMLAILVLQFNSFRYAGYVLSIVPFSLIGIFAGLAVSGQPLSFPSVMGFIALTGIVVNNSIILIDVMNNIRRENPDKSIEDVVLEGTTSRLRPILLTTLTTVIGVMPLLFSSALWAPLAWAIIFGLTFSVVLTLILIPIIYRRWPGVLPEEKEKLKLQAEEAVAKQ